MKTEELNPPFTNAYWVAPRLLLAGPYPGDVNAVVRAAKLKALADAGIRVLVNLQPVQERGRGGAAFRDLEPLLADHGISMHRFPIPDMDVPPAPTMSAVLDTIDECQARRQAVYVHCWGGHGRTGTVVGCWLQRHGLAGQTGPLARIKELRAFAGINSDSPQTDAQRRMVTTWPSPDAIPRANRLAGAVWGALVGDAIGVPYEFGPARTPESVAWGTSGTHSQPAGTWSDDGGLLLALLDSLLRSGFDTEDQARRSVAWLHGPEYKPGPLFDVGITTRKALSAIRGEVPAEEAGGKDEKDNGNGSLMRILPVALVGKGDAAQLVENAERASSVTHAHPRSRLVCALYCLVAGRLLDGEGDRKTALEGALADLRILRSDHHREELDLIAGYQGRTGSGYVVDCFWSAWTAFESTSSYESCVKRAVAFGGDTDTTACVAGGLAGIYWGVSGIPADWLTAMRGQAIVEPLVGLLVASGGESGGSDRRLDVGISTTPQAPPSPSPARGDGLDSQQTELIGRSLLVGELLRDGLEVARPERDRGIDLVAYLDTAGARFIAAPIQLKAFSSTGFSLDSKYERFPSLLLAYVWFVAEPSRLEIYCLTYPEAHGLAELKGWTRTPSWQAGKYANTRPGVELRGLLQPFKMTPGTWIEKVRNAAKYNPGAARPTS